MGQIVQAYKQAQQTWIWKKPGKTLNWKSYFYQKNQFFTKSCSPLRQKRAWNTLVLWWWVIVCSCSWGGWKVLLVHQCVCVCMCSQVDCEISRPSALWTHRTHAGRLIRSPPAHFHCSTVTKTLWSPSLILWRKLWGVLLRYIYLDALLLLQTSVSLILCSGLEMHDSLSGSAFVFW